MTKPTEHTDAAWYGCDGCGCPTWGHGEQCATCRRRAAGDFERLRAFPPVCRRCRRAKTFACMDGACDATPVGQRSYPGGGLPRIRR